MLYLFVRAVFGGVALLFVGCVPPKSNPTPQPQPQQPPAANSKTVFEIISNRAIWGKDFPLALAYVEALAKTGDKTVEIFPSALAGSRRFANAQAAESALRSTNAALVGADRSELFPKVKKNFPFAARTPKTEVLKVPESDSVLVGLNFGQAQLLNPDMKITAIQKELGPAERVSYLTIHGEGESNPLTLTMYSYANGAIIFAESNFTARPRLLERVYFNVPDLVNSLKANLK